MRVTITGFDQWFAATDLVKLHRLERTVDVEFAVLLGPGTGREPRYPAPSVIEAFAAFTERGGIPSALHVCGPLAREALRDPCPKGLAGLAAKFGRVQINGCEEDVAGMLRFQNRIHRSVIAQMRSGFRKERGHPRLEYLYDPREHRNSDGFADWPAAPRDARCGYAGGLGPDNARTAARRAAALGGRWIDVDEGVRTEDRLDKTKIQAVIRAAARLQQPTANANADWKRRAGRRTKETV